MTKTTVAKTTREPWLYMYDMGTHRQLFVDNLVIRDMRNCRKTLHQPRKFEGNPVLSPDQPWEENMICLGGTVLYDEELNRFRMWYMCWKGFGYAESVDGVEWVKPKRDAFPYLGKKTNIVYRGLWPDELDTAGFIVDTVSVFKTPDDPDPDRRYKLFTFQGDCNLPDHLVAKRFGYYIAFSPDGVNWKMVAEPVLSAFRDDSALSDRHTVMYDTVKKRFVAFTKQTRYDQDSMGDRGTNRRTCGISFSNNFIHWTCPIPCLAPDDMDPATLHFYSMSGFNYENMYLGLLEAYDAGIEGELARTINIQLLSSRDGERWSRAGDRQLFMHVGAENAWDRGMLWNASSPPLLVDDEIWIYYNGRSLRHDPIPPCGLPDQQTPDERFGAVGLAKLRRDGFVSVDADEDGGDLLTKRLLFGGRNLYVNADVAQGGEIRVELVDPGERNENLETQQALRDLPAVTGFDAASCQPIVGDVTNTKVGWRGAPDLRSFGEQPMCLRFVMRNASLYSFWTE